VLAGLEETNLIRNPLGMGMGQGANAITKLLTGSAKFLAGEGEFSRVVTEMGPFMGIAFLLFRCLLTLWILRQALARAADRDLLALLLFPAVLLTLIMGVLEQPTEQGFMVVSVAMSLAALKPAGQRALRPAIENQRFFPVRPMVRPN
jgi:hypothetical protein